VPVLRTSLSRRVTGKGPETSLAAAHGDVAEQL
jgi:hypothetical protein